MAILAFTRTACATNETCFDIPEADPVSDKAQTVLAEAVEVGVPGQELRNRDVGQRSDDTSARIEGLPCVQWALRRLAETLPHGGVEVPTIDIEAVVLQEDVGRDAHGASDRVAGV